MVGPDGNDLSGKDTINGVPAGTLTEVATRLLTLRGREPLRPDYGADFSSCASHDNPAEAVRDEVLRALGESIDCGVSAKVNADANMVDVEMREMREDGESNGWSIEFNISLEDGLVGNLSSSVVFQGY